MPDEKTMPDPTENQHVRRGGLRVGLRGQLPPALSAVLTIGFFEVVFFLLIPFSIHRFSDHPWESVERLGVMGLSILR